jgi:hypothetical protein
MNPVDIQHLRAEIKAGKMVRIGGRSARNESQLQFALRHYEGAVVDSAKAEGEKPATKKRAPKAKAKAEAKAEGEKPATEELGDGEGTAE